MFYGLLKIVLFGFLATIAAKTGITLFYEFFPPERPQYLNQVQALKAALVGTIFASPFLFFLVRSIKVNKNQHNLPFKEGIRVNQENLNERESFFEGVKELKRK
tara:strand:+ start:7637 stop:7948 length:312 start_codon:yes stop_codon:yes gene_type:complete